MTGDLHNQMNRWMNQRQEEIDNVLIEFNSDSYLSSDSNIYDHESDATENGAVGGDNKSTNAVNINETTPLRAQANL